jgi:hypothetical protein
MQISPGSIQAQTPLLDDPAVVARLQDEASQITDGIRSRLGIGRDDPDVSKLRSAGRRIWDEIERLEVKITESIRVSCDCGPALDKLRDGSFDISYCSNGILHSVAC